MLPPINRPTLLSLVFQIVWITGLDPVWLHAAADNSEAVGHGVVEPEREAPDPHPQTQDAGDLLKLTLAARDNHRPITAEQINSLRQQLHQRAHLLEQALESQGNLFSQQWKDYLKWNLLEQQLSPTAKIQRRTLINLDRLLNQFRSNHPGLERPEFTHTAEAIERLWVAIRWTLERNPRKYYQRQLAVLSQQLKHHQTEVTSETSWKIGHLMGRLDQLGQSASLVSVLQDFLVQPNVRIEISKALLQQIGQKPVRNTQPVRDFILGTSIRGTAHTTGAIQIRTLPSQNDVQLDIQLTGLIQSRTQGHQHPVCIYSSGNTDFSATKQITLSADSFQASSAVVHAITQTDIHSIQKTGGPFGHRLIEKIAWKKAGQSKKCAEQIASRHAEVRIASNFDEQLATTLSKARQNYQQKILAPLIRRNMFPSHLQMSSQSDRIQVETTFASRHQLASAGATPPLKSPNDLAVRIHQSAVTNYLALVMAGVTIQQQTEDQPPKLTGNLPPWMANISLDEHLQNKPTSTKTDTETTEEEAEDQLQSDETDFQPWSITLNTDQPVSVLFDNQQLVLRMRASHLISSESEHKNWDFIVRYDVTSKNNAVMLRRNGKIEVFPTGFDPRWPTRMSAAKSGFRSTLAKNMNARADRGEGFPDEIPIPSIQLPPETGIQGELILEQLDCDNHWLTLSWALP